MRTSGKLMAAVLAFVLIAFAQTQVATITSDGPFQLRGANVTPGQGVPSWPVMPGDTIKAGDKPLTIAFSDGSTIDLAPWSSAKVDWSGKTPVFQLESGSAHYSLKTLDSVKLMTLNNSVTPKDLAGVLQIGSQKATGGWWTAGHTTAVVVGAGAAAGLSVGVAKATRHGPPVSPSVCNNGNGNGSSNAQPPCQ